MAQSKRRSALLRCLLGLPCLAATLALGAACHHVAGVPVAPEGDTFAELRAVKGEVTVVPPGETGRAPYPRERIAEGEGVAVGAGGLAWIRRDAGAVWLVAGPAHLTLRASSFTLTDGRAFIDSQDGPTIDVESPQGHVELADARASIEAAADGGTQVYVLRGSARAGGAGRAGPGERLTLRPDGTSARTSEIAWDDWTGGLATADPSAEPAPFGIGTVGARPPGDKGKPRFSLVVQRLDVRVTIDHDFAETEVDETFANPTADTVEGIFSFRTPPDAVLHRFGVDRSGSLVWGRIQESRSAEAQYQSNVYQGSTEDPALLQWSAPGVYTARLYPIAGGAQRRVVTRYAEWLPRQGTKADRRLYVYPMAAEGARGSLPRIEELTVTFDLAKAGASRVRAGMGGKRDGNRVVMKAFDFVPRADLAVELLDGGEAGPTAYRAPHALSVEDAPENADATFAKKVSGEERDYLLVPVRSTAPSDLPPGVDLAIVVDTSAATEAGALAVARSLTGALLAHLGPDDRAALWAGDAVLRPVTAGSGELGALDATKRRAWLAGLAAVERGGATDIGALLTQAANGLDPKRRGAVVYIGDGQPSVGEVSPKALGERMARLPAGTRVLAAGVGSHANLALLQSVARGAPVEGVSDGYGAARTALRLLAAVQRPAWFGAKVDLGPGVERVLPVDLPPVPADEGVLVVGRISGKVPTEIVLSGSGGTARQPLAVRDLVDGGDLRRRWAEYRLAELMAEGAGRAAMVDVGRRFGIVSPFTSLYVPTAREAESAGESSSESSESLADLRAAGLERRSRWKPWQHEGASSAPLSTVREATVDMKEGGTGTRAKGEEGSMGNPAPKSALRDIPAEPMAMASAAATAAPQQVVPLSAPAYAAAAPVARPSPASPAAPRPAAAAGPAGGGGRADAAKNAAGHMFGDTIGDSMGAGGLGLSGVGEGAGGPGASTNLQGLSQLAGGIGTGRGRLGGGHSVNAPRLQEGAVSVSGRLPPEVIQRIVRQNFGRFRLCYENGLRLNPTLAGRVTVKFIVDQHGAVTLAADAGSDLPDQGVVQCVARGVGNLSFPQPEGGMVTVVYPIAFSPPDSSLAPTQVVPKPGLPPLSPPPPIGPLATVGHTPRPCGPAADLALDERRILWRERLASSGDSATDVLVVYRQALESCEAPTWRERYPLLLSMVDRLGSIRERVALWRALLWSPVAADVVYRSILVRVQSAADLRELHDALGLATVDPDLLARTLAKAKTPSERFSLLRATALKWPDDTELALRVLDGYEDAGDDAGGRAWARRLRRRVDANAHVYTSVGEYYLRLAKKENGATADRDVEEGRRTFGELVEFAPEDPAARRRLGDLLRAHGWYDEALRQYETLAQLTPDDPLVPLLLAASAQGMGRVEEAVRWAEKAAATGSPDGSSPLARSARAMASAFLAWACDEATRGGKKDDVDRLRSRARRIAGTDAQPGSVRLIVTWSHPELHPALWTSALGSPMPAHDNFPLFGLAEATLPSSPTTVVELHLDPEDAARAARLGAKAVVTAIVGEGTPDQRIARLDVGFGGAGRAPVDNLKIDFDGSVLKAEGP